MSNLFNVINEIRSQTKCAGCPLFGKRKPLIIEPNSWSKIRAVVITESPWEPMEDIERLVSICNLNTYPYIYCLFSGKFRPIGDANVYWTHTCKCHLKGASRKERRKAIKFCSNAYLKSEIEAIKPRLVVTVGKSALSYMAEVTKDNRLTGRLEIDFKNQANGIYDKVRLGSAYFSLAIVPHPSGKNRFWNKISKDADSVKTFQRHYM